MKRYLVLLALAVVAAAALSAVARRPAPLETAPAAAAPLPEAAFGLVIEGGSVTPETGAVPKDHRVRLTVSNQDERPVTLTLAGYEERLPPHRFAPGETWRAEFEADRPGEGFAWLLDGRPVGRLQVTGSHLVEGHR